MGRFGRFARAVGDERDLPAFGKGSAALVTSGTATLETCMFRGASSGVLLYAAETFHRYVRRLVLKVKYVSLVNLIADREVVPELVAGTFSVENIRRELEAILPGGSKRQQMLSDYEEVHRRLGDNDAPDRATELMIELLNP